MPTSLLPPTEQIDAVGEDSATADKAMFAHHDFLTAYIARRIRSPQDVEDYVQDVYLRVIQATSPQTKIRNWRGILGKAASTVIVDRHRRITAQRRGRRMELAEDIWSIADPLADPEMTTIHRARLAAIVDVMSTIDACCRSAFVMARIEGLKHKAVASRLGMPTVAVGRCIEKVLARLARKELDDDSSY